LGGILQRYRPWITRRFPKNGTALIFRAIRYNNTAYYPATPDLQSSLTIFNSSSSEFTLNAMTIVSILIPFVLAYIIYAWRAMEKNRTDIEDINNDHHAY
jgi:cytochrome d ubiquinol oxidase subunit II